MNFRNPGAAERPTKHTKHTKTLHRFCGAVWPGFVCFVGIIRTGWEVGSDGDSRGGSSRKTGLVPGPDIRKHSGLIP